MNDNIFIGCVADDFTGASDAASFIAKEGVKTVLCDGVPENFDGGGCQAVVVALKTRSIQKDKAAAETKKAVEFLKKIGAEQFYFKYCSTFDSTREGNIGPVADCLMEVLDVPYTLLCPSLPVNKRTVKDGCLYVDGVPLQESHMKNHPLNPMWDCDLSRLMEPQSSCDCLNVTSDMLYGPSEALCKAIDDFGRGRKHFYLVPDYVTDEDGKKIAEIFGGLRFLTGGSGLLEHLADRCRGSKKRLAASEFPNGTAGRGLALCGSCSKATKEQIADFKQNGGRYVTVDPAKLLSGAQSVDKIWRYIQEDPAAEVLVYSIGAEVQVQKTGDEAADAKVSKLLEDTMAELGRRAYEAGFTRIIVGGGETSGAVTQALSLDSFFIGESVAPGVPIMIPTKAPNMRIVLKSGNFGQTNFFRRALRVTRG